MVAMEWSQSGGVCPIPDIWAALRAPRTPWRDPGDPGAPEQSGSGFPEVVQRIQPANSTMRAFNMIHILVPALVATAAPSTTG